MYHKTDKTMIKGYKYRLNPTPEQITQMEKTFGCCRYVYNWALDLKIKTYQGEKRSMSAVDLCKQLTLLKKDENHLWLNEVSNECLQQSIRCMDSAFTKFFREHTGFPKFKSKHHSKPSFKNINSVRIDFDNSRVKLPIVGWVNFYKNRSFEGKIGTVTVSKSITGEYYVSILVEDENPLPEKFPITSTTSVGIDVGLKDFAVLSNGQVFQNPKYLEKSSQRLSCLQRRLSRKKKGSNRYKRAKLAVAICHERIRNRRSDFLHKVSKKIISENQTIIIEDLNVEGMLKNHCLAKGIASASWSEFFRMLQYKSEWNGVNLIRIGRFDPSSKMCSCGYIYKDLKLSDRTWTCPECGSKNDRDLLAAQNIKKFGLEKQNLLTQENINKTPVVNREGDVELSAVAGVVKRQIVLV